MNLAICCKFFPFEYFSHNYEADKHVKWFA